jgi:sugar-specific transcriptional regulator TrmB
MQNLNDIFNLIGFTNSESNVYLALLDLGSTKTGPLIKKSLISQGKVYVILDKLIDKGLVTYTIKSGIKYFQPKNPDMLIEWFERKEIELKEKKVNLLKILPELQQKYLHYDYQKQVEVYEGFNALKLLYNSLLDEDKEMYTIGNTPKVPEILETYLIQWHKKRINKNIGAKFIYGLERKKYAEDRESMKCTEVRYLQMATSPSWITVVGDFVITVSFTDINNITCFLVKDESIAKAQKEYFDLMWFQGKK